jgi:hypothetical protein
MDFDGKPASKLFPQQQLPQYCRVPKQLQNNDASLLRCHAMSLPPSVCLGALIPASSRCIQVGRDTEPVLLHMLSGKLGSYCFVREAVSLDTNHTESRSNRGGEVAKNGGGGQLIGRLPSAPTRNLRRFGVLNQRKLLLNAPG